MHDTWMDFQEASGCNRMVLSRYMSGEVEPYFTSIVRICTNLNVSPKWLILGDESEAPDK